MLKAPWLSLRAGRETWEKFPYISVAPPTVVRAGKTMVVNRVLFWIWRPPVIDFKESIVTLVKRVLVLMARVPPTEVRFGAVRPEMEFS